MAPPYTPPGGSSALAWTNALSLRWTAQTPQTFTSNGAYTIQGATWNKVNSVNDRVAMAIAAQGLVIKPAATGNYNAPAVLTAAGMTSLVTQFIPGLQLGYQLRLRCGLSSANDAVTFDGFLMAIQSGALNTVTNCLRRGYGASSTGFQSFILAGGLNPGTSSSTATLTGTTSYAMEMTYTLGNPQVVGRFGSFTAGAQWPTAWSMVKGIELSNQDMVGITAANATIYLGGMRDGVGTATLEYNLDFTELDYLPIP